MIETCFQSADIFTSSIVYPVTKSAEDIQMVLSVPNAKTHTTQMDTTKDVQVGPKVVYIVMHYVLINW